MYRPTEVKNITSVIYIEKKMTVIRRKGNALPIDFTAIADRR